MTALNPYISFNGNCREAFNFYKKIFGGEFSSLQTFGNVPPEAGMTVNEEEKDKIMHMSLPIGEKTVLMGSDTPKSMPSTIGNNISLSLHPKSEQEAGRLFTALSEGGKVTMPLAKAFWNAYFGMCTDKFGINWMINYDYGQGE